MYINTGSDFGFDALDHLLEASRGLLRLFNHFSGQSAQRRGNTTVLYRPKCPTASHRRLHGCLGAVFVCAASKL